MISYEPSAFVEGASKGNVCPLRGLSCWEQPLPLALMKIHQLFPKIKTLLESLEPKGASGGRAVPGGGPVC